MFLEPVGDTAAIEAVLQLTHAVMVERGTLDQVGHESLGSVAACICEAYSPKRQPQWQKLSCCANHIK